MVNRAFLRNWLVAQLYAFVAMTIGALSTQCVVRAKLIQALRLASVLLARISTIVELRSTMRLARRKDEINQTLRLNASQSPNQNCADDNDEQNSLQLMVSLHWQSHELRAGCPSTRDMLVFHHRVAHV
jgi:hypothetical protein